MGETISIEQHLKIVDNLIKNYQGRLKHAKDELDIRDHITAIKQFVYAQKKEKGTDTAMFLSKLLGVECYFDYDLSTDEQLLSMRFRDTRD